MLFFELDFLLRFLLPTAAMAAILRVVVPLSKLAPWAAILASLWFLLDHSSISAAIAILSICINYFAARNLLETRARLTFALAVTANLLVLGYFKYSILIDSTFFHVEVPWEWRLALPLGISFYTFQQIAFLSDVYHGKVTSFSFKTYALFKLYFPQFIAGPIVHFERVRSSYERWPTFNVRSIRYGLIIIGIGFVKKFAGDYFGDIADDLFERQSSLTAYEAWLAMFAFTFQIYFDFSGYSDMAVGLARLFGVSLPWNFNSPYKSKSVSEFWRRWHITLSNWLRDYLYIPLGGNRRGPVRTVLSLFLTMALGGLWHGASWTFLAWGAVHGIALIVMRFFGSRSVSPALRAASVFLFVSFAWVLFRSTSFEGAMDHYFALFDVTAPGLGIELLRIANLLMPVVGMVGAPNSPEQVGQVGALLAAAFVCFTAPNSQQTALWCAARKLNRFLLLELPLLAALILIISMAFISPDTTNAFIYFEF